MNSAGCMSMPKMRIYLQFIYVLLRLMHMLLPSWMQTNKATHLFFASFFFAKWWERNKEKSVNYEAKEIPNWSFRLRKLLSDAWILFFIENWAFKSLFLNRIAQLEERTNGALMYLTPTMNAGPNRRTRAKLGKNQRHLWVNNLWSNSSPWNETHKPT